MAPASSLEPKLFANEICETSGILKVLENRDVDTIVALGKTGDSCVVDVLISALSDEYSMQVRVTAAEALGLIGDKCAIGALYLVMQSEYISEMRMVTAQAIENLQ